MRLRNIRVRLSAYFFIWNIMITSFITINKEYLLSFLNCPQPLLKQFPKTTQREARYIFPSAVSVIQKKWPFCCWTGFTFSEVWWFPSDLWLSLHGGKLGRVSSASLPLVSKWRPDSREEMFAKSGKYWFVEFWKCYPALFQVFKRRPKLLKTC